MSYSYGMKGAPAVGGGLPGLPQRGAGGSASVLVRSTYTRIVTPGSGVIEPPEGAKFMRVAVVGGGGGAIWVPGAATTRAGGGGGGCAASRIVPASDVPYICGVAGARKQVAAAAPDSASAGGDSSATVAGELLIGRGGQPGSNLTEAVFPNAGKGGFGEGGTYNFSGGNAGGNFGGGGAGPNGNGGFHDTNSNLPTPGYFSGEGWGCGGGGSGSLSVNTVGASNWFVPVGGAGAGANSFYGKAYDTKYTEIMLRAMSGQGPFGTSFTVASVGAAPVFNGGEFGGGGSSESSGDATSGNTSGTAGGVGGILVEWFY